MEPVSSFGQQDHYTSTTTKLESSTSYNFLTTTTTVFDRERSEACKRSILNEAEAVVEKPFCQCKLSQAIDVNGICQGW